MTSLAFTSLDTTPSRMTLVAEVGDLYRLCSESSLSLEKLEAAEVLHHGVSTFLFGAATLTHLLDKLSILATQYGSRLFSSDEAYLFAELAVETDGQKNYLDSKLDSFMEHADLAPYVPFLRKQHLQKYRTAEKQITERLQQ